MFQGSSRLSGGFSIRSFFSGDLARIIHFPICLSTVNNQRHWVAFSADTVKVLMASTFSSSRNINNNNKLWDIKVLFVRLEQSPKVKKVNRKNWRSEVKSRLSRLQPFWDWQECWKESWTPEEICYHSDSREKPPALANMKNSQKRIKFTKQLDLIT